MAVRIITQKEIEALLPMDECVEVMERTLHVVARGNAVNPLRTAMLFPDKSGLVGMMPAYLTDPEGADSTGIKIVTVMPGNHGTEYDSHQGVVVLFDTRNGTPLAIMDATTITAIRTAAVSGVATRALSREDSKTLAILGSGVQARTHLEAMTAVRDITEVRVWSRSRAGAERFAERSRDRYGIPVDAADSAADATSNADIICTTTSSKEPILSGEWIATGTHVNAVGACMRRYRELDTAAVAGSRLYVDRMESALNEAGDFLIPREEGAIDDTHIVGELGDVLTGGVSGRRSDGEITLFKSLGIGAEDVGAAKFVYEKAERQNVGVSVDLGGKRL